MDCMESLSIYEKFTRDSLEALLFCDFDARVLMWNQGCHYLFGYSEEEMKNYSVFSLIDKEDFESFVFLFELLKKGRGLSFETRGVSKSSNILNIEVTAGEIKNEDNGSQVIYFVFRDLSKRKKMEKRLKQLAMYPENNPDFLMEWDRFLGITYVNRSVKDFFANNNMDMNIDLEKILPDEFQNHMRRLVGTDRKLEGVENNFNDYIFTYTFVPFKGDGDKVLIIGKDITARKTLEEEIDSAYGRTRHVLDFIESTLQEFRFIDLDEEINLISVTHQVIRDLTDQVSLYPTHIFVAMENEERLLEGFIVAKRHGMHKVVSDKILIHPRKLSSMVSESGELKFANWYDLCSNIEDFQNSLPEELSRYLPEIRNFASYRVTGEKNGALIAFNYPKDVNIYDGETVKGLSVAMGTLFSIQSQFKGKEEAQFTILVKMAELAEKRDRETGEHLKRMRNYARLVASQLSRLPKYKDTIDREYVRKIYNAAPLHDIGKVGIPDAILQKPGKFNDIEYETMQKHTIIGGNILEGPKFLEMSKIVAYYHHEKFDGSGYPFGLAGEDIPLCARIVAIADVYDAMTSKRVYKEAFSHERTKKLISICSGGHFDPDIVNAFLERERDFLRVKGMYHD